jgi:hypothetical protein
MFIPSKKILAPTLAALCLALATLTSCLVDSRLVHGSRGVLQVEIAGTLVPAPTRGDGEWLSSMRLIVFTDLATSPRVEINRLITIGELDMVPATGATPARAKTVVEVERRPAGENSRLVVAIVNEPDTPQMRAALEAISTPGELGDLELDMAHFVSADHLSLRDGVAVPMTGAVWTDRLFRSVEEASREWNSLKLEVQRTVARIDVCLKRGTDVEAGLKMAAGSTVVLDNTFDKTRLVYHSDGINTIGQIQAVDSEDMFDRTWTLSSGEQDFTADTPVCSFYTPERGCTRDRLKLDIAIKTPEGATRSGSLTIFSALDADRVEHPVDIVRRNNIYRVTVTIGANGMTAEVSDWVDQNITTEF